MGQLDGKTALVTGGTSGIGLATARRLADEGAYVFVTGRDRTRLDAAVASIGAHGIQSDISKIRREDMEVIEYLRATDPDAFKRLKKEARAHRKAG